MGLLWAHRKRCRRYAWSVQADQTTPAMLSTVSTADGGDLVLPYMDIPPKYGGTSQTLIFKLQVCRGLPRFDFCAFLTSSSFWVNR